MSQSDALADLCHDEEVDTKYHLLPTKRIPEMVALVQLSHRIESAWSELNATPRRTCRVLIARFQLWVL